MPTVHASTLRAYGPGGLSFSEDQEEQRGCPRVYRLRYEDYRPSPSSEIQRYGTVMHRALEIMETQGWAPEEALKRVWDTQLDLQWYEEALGDLREYLARPDDGLAVLETELWLVAHLYDDETFGPVWIAGTMDRVDLDPQEPAWLRVRDYKTNRRPSSFEEVTGDVQLLTYDYLVRQNAKQEWGINEAELRVSVILDALKWRPLEVEYTEGRRAAFLAWAEGVTRRILRDDVGDPELNPGCTLCSFKLDCPAFLKLPGRGRSLHERRMTTRLELGGMIAWREEAGEVRKLLDAGIREVDDATTHKALAEGGFAAGGKRYERVEATAKVADLERLLDVLGPERFLKLASVSWAAAERMLKDTDDKDLRDQVEACFDRLVTGEKVTVRKDRV